MNLHFFKVEVHIFVTVEDVWSLVQEVIKELSHQEGSSLVLLSAHVHLVLKLNVVSLEQLVVVLGSLELLFDFLELVLQEVNQVFIGLVVSGFRSDVALGPPALVTRDASHCWML